MNRSPEGSSPLEIAKVYYEQLYKVNAHGIAANLRSMREYAAHVRKPFSDIYVPIALLSEGKNRQELSLYANGQISLLIEEGRYPVFKEDIEQISYKKLLQGMVCTDDRTQDADIFGIVQLDTLSQAKLRHMETLFRSGGELPMSSQVNDFIGDQFPYLTHRLMYAMRRGADTLRKVFYNPPKPGDPFYSS